MHSSLPTALSRLLPFALALSFLAGPQLARSAPQATSKSPTERELLAAFKQSFDTSDSAARAAAVTTLGDASRALPDKGAGKKLAQALAKALEDPEPEVGQAACFQLARGREVETTIEALGSAVRRHVEQLGKELGATDLEARNYVKQATVLLGNLGRVLANHPDDRAAAILVEQLGAVPKEAKKRDLARLLLGQLAQPTLDLGTLAAFETAVKLLQTLDFSAQDGPARSLHDALSTAATKAGMTPPEWAEASAAAWPSWLEAHRAQLPKKLGQLAAPVATDPRPMPGLPGKDAG